MNKAIKTFIGALMMAGVFGCAPAVLGWGVTDMGRFFAHPARAVMLAVSFAALFVFMAIKDRFGVKFIRKGEKESLRHRLMVIIPTILWPFLVGGPAYCDARGLLTLGGGDAVRYAGVVVFLAGTVFMIWGPLHLGRRYSALVTIQQDHKLVTDGPYRIVRHPRYAGIILWAFGVALIYLSIIGLVLAGVMSALMLWRIPDEERLLAEHFGREWESYRNRVKKLVPLVY